ncbi:MAG: hypothetical protein JWN30_2761 [Bacilli bacterium]|nr:hypothetical protein [Bacilli bacterium]
MKIGDSSRTYVDLLGTREDKAAGTQQPQFQEMIAASSAKLQKNQLDGLLKSIDQLGGQLAKQCNWQALMAYKDQIKQFLQTALRDGYRTEERTGRDRRGRTRLYKIVAQIDDLLAELTQMVLAEEKEHLVLLEKIGDLRGLLLNLYW